MIVFADKPQYNMDDLMRIVEILRAPGGCPWDREQTHRSIEMNFLEETYEAVDAIRLGDAHLLCEELGDVLLQVALHTQMETEAGGFTIGEVTDGICRKLIYRHPHVFGDVQAKTGSEVLQNWEKLKVAEKGRQDVGDNIDSVPRALPALIRAAKVQKRAAVCPALDYPHAQAALTLLRAEVEELAQALENGNAQQAQEELGDVLFSAVNVARKMRVDAEQALTASTDKFSARIKAMNTAAAQQGKQLAECTDAELDALWLSAKKEIAAK